MRKRGKKKNEKKLEILVITEKSMCKMSKSTFTEIGVEWVLEQIINNNKKAR